MAIKIQAPEEKVKLPVVYSLLLVASFLMISVTLLFLISFVI